MCARACRPRLARPAQRMMVRAIDIDLSGGCATECRRVCTYAARVWVHTTDGASARTHEHARRACTPHLNSRTYTHTDTDTQLAVAGVLLGLVAGLGAPAWYISRTERDEERLEELRAMNRANYSATGEYMTEVGGGWGVFWGATLAPQLARPRGGGGGGGQWPHS